MHATYLYAKIFHAHVDVCQKRCSARTQPLLPPPSFASAASSASPSFSPTRPSPSLISSVSFGDDVGDPAHAPLDVTVEQPQIEICVSDSDDDANIASTTFSCNACGKSSPTKNGLLTHIGRVHAKEANAGWAAKLAAKKNLQPHNALRAGSSSNNKNSNTKSASQRKLAPSDLVKLRSENAAWNDRFQNAPVTDVNNDQFDKLVREHLQFFSPQTQSFPGLCIWP